MQRAHGHLRVVGAPDGPTDEALVREVRAGSRGAQRALFDRYAPMVNGLAIRLLGRDSEVDDLVQETFAQVFGSLARLEQPGAVRGWIAAITVRTAHKLIRTRRLLTRFGLRSSTPIDVETMVSPSESPEIVAELRLLYGIVENLPAELRIPLLLRVVDERTLPEIAELTGVSLAATKRRLAKAEAQLERARRRDG